MAWRRRGIAADQSGITEGVIWKQLLFFFFPILLGTFFQQLYNTADAIIVGKHLGKQALAAVGGSTGTLINLIVGFFVGLSSGATVILSQYFGAKKEREVSDTVHTAIALAIAGGAALMALGLALTRPLLQMIGTPPDVMNFAVTYMRIYFCGMVPSMIYNIGSGILRAVGDSRRPLYFLICSCMVNIVLDVVLVMGLEMSVAGAALATILSQAVSAALVLLTLTRSQQSYRLEPRKVRFHWGLLKRVFAIGLPAGVQSVLYSVSNVIILGAVNGFKTDALAAWTAYGKLDGLFWMTISAFGIAITTYVGQNFGARKFDRMRRSVWVCMGMAAAATVLLSLFLLTCGESLYRLFSDDKEVIRQGMEILRLLVPTYVTYLCIEIFSGALRGTGDSLIPTLMTLFGVCVLRAVWVLAVAPAYHQLTVVLLCYPITWTVTSLMFLAYYLKGGWFQRGLRRAGMQA